MVRISALNRLSVLTVGGTLLLGITLWTSSHSQSIEKPDTPLKVALVLDCITQPRFQEDMKNFGMSRMLPTAGGHLMAGRLLLSSPKERDLFKTAENSHRDFVIGFFHCAHIPGKLAPARSVPGQPSTARTEKPAGKGGFGSMTGSPGFSDPVDSISQVCNHMLHLYHGDRKIASEEDVNVTREMGKAAQKALPKLMKGQGAEQDAGNWLVVARPVLAMKTSCLKCHQGAKIGDTLGVLTYAVNKKAFPNDPSIVSQRGGF
jgi:hypothetical protein